MKVFLRILGLVGLVMCLVGCRIYFAKAYHWVNGYRPGQESQAAKVGKWEMAIGAVLMFLALCGLLF